MATLKINKKDDVILKILHYFITEEDYKPVIINGLQNEIWLENMEKGLKLIRINTNYIHNNEQYNFDLYKAQSIMKNIKRKTFSFNMTMLNLLLDTGENVNVIGTKNIETVKVEKVNDIKKNKVVTELFPNIKKSNFSDKTDPIEFFKMTDDMNQKTIKDEKKLAKIFSPKKPVSTYVLIAINILVFLFMYIGNNYSTIMMNFANNYLFLQQGQYYRLITCTFMHANLIHLGFNMYALYVLGSQVERYYGYKKFLLIYFISGLLGSLFSAVFMSATGFSVGASGAIFGLLGAIAYFTYHYRATLQDFMRSPIIPVIVINLAIGLIYSNIDMSAHIGGLIGGVLSAMMIGIGDKGRKTERINGIIVLALMIGFMFYFLTIK